MKMTMNRSKAMHFTADGLRLSGVLHVPKARPWAIVIGCHGLMANKQSPKQIDLAGRCNAAGMAYFRFDHRGCGESEGVFEQDTTLENRVNDLLAAFRHLRGNISSDLPVGLFGSSLGGTVCLTAAHAIEPFAIATLAAPVRNGAIQMPADTPQALMDEVFRTRMRFDIARTLANLHHILIIHGSADETVSIENAHTIFANASAPKQRLILEGSDHRITDREHQAVYMQAVVDWFTDHRP